MERKFLLSVIVFFVFASISFGQFQNVRVSDINNTSRPNEVSIAIDPLNSANIAAGSNLHFFYSSADSGKTWTEKKMVSPSYGVWGDPVLIYDTEANLYFAHLSNPPNNGHWIDRIVVQKSTDNGANWDDGVGIGYAPPTKNQDKEWLAVDFTNGEHRNNIYMSWTEFDDYGSSSSIDSSRILFSRSIDSGKTWSAPVRISDTGGNCIDSDLTVEGAVPTVGPNGDVYVSWAGPLGLMFDKSTDGGQTFGADIFVSDIPGGWDFEVSGINRCNGMPITVCDISGNSTNGNIYILWGDQRNGTTNSDVFISKSTDGGETWTSAKKVNDDNTQRHQFFPWVTIDQSTGYIYAVFYDRRNTTDLYTEVYLARSIDGGETFVNHKISKTAFNPRSSVFFGDYTNIAAKDGMIFPIWMRMDYPEMSVWAARINESDFLTDIKNNETLLEQFNLSQNYPNPFNPSTVISFQIPQTEKVRLEVFSVLGDKVKTLLDQRMKSGVHEIDFDASDLTSGIYFYKITAGNFISTKKMTLLK